MIWCVSGSGITEAAEWRIFVVGWLFIPPLALIVSFAVALATVRLGASFVSLGSVLVLLSSATILASVGLLRYAAPSWSYSPLQTFWEPWKEPSFHPQYGILCAAIAVVFPLLNVLALSAAALSARGRWRPFPAPRLAAIAAVLGPILATLACVTAAVQDPLPPLAVLCIASLSALAVAASWLVAGKRPSRWLVYASGSIVVSIIAWVTLDPHLHFDAGHYNWYLGPVHEILHGRTMMGEIVSPYGVLPMYFLALILWATGIPLSYYSLALVVSFLSLVSYSLIYFLLRTVLRTLGAALVAMALMLVVPLLGVRLGVTVFPSTGPLRFGPVYLLLVATAFRLRFPQYDRPLRVAESLFVGVASLWSIETLIYVLAAYAGIVGVETVHASRAGRPWLRDLLLSLAWLLLFVGGVQLGFAGYVASHSGEWPRWSEYLAMVRAYAAEGVQAAPAPLGGMWVPVVLTYLGSLLACVHVLPTASSYRQATKLAIVAAMTMAGVAQLTYWVGTSIQYRITIVAAPAIFVGSYWFENVTQRVPARGLSEELSLSWCAAFAALVLVFQYAPIVREWSAHGSPTSYLSRFARRCASFPDCVLNPEPTSPDVANVLDLARQFAPGQAEAAFFLSPRATTEATALVGRPHAFPLLGVAARPLYPGPADRIVHSAHRLKAGDVIFVDRTVVGTGVNRRPELEDFDLISRIVLERICSEFECVPERSVTFSRSAYDRAGPGRSLPRGVITVERLQPR